MRKILAEICRQEISLNLCALFFLFSTLAQKVVFGKMYSKREGVKIMSEKPMGPSEFLPEEKETGVTWEPEVDVAKAGAYTEKPFQDAIVDYKEKLGEKFGEESVKALEWLASEEAEKAMAAYREEKDKEDPRIRLLREKAEQTIQLTVPFGSSNIEAVVRKQVKAIGMKEVEKNIAGETIAGETLDMRQALERIPSIGGALNLGIELSVSNELPRHLMERVCIRFNKGHWSTEHTILMLEGRMITDLATGKCNRGISNLECIAELDERSVNDVTREHLGVIVDTRKMILATYENAEQNVKWIDGGMEDLGWMWDEKTGTYISLEGEK